MKKQELFDALNAIAEQQGLTYWIPVTLPSQVPRAINTLATLLWYKQAPEDTNTQLMREQLDYLWGKDGFLKFDWTDGLESKIR